MLLLMRLSACCFCCLVLQHSGQQPTPSADWGAAATTAPGNGEDDVGGSDADQGPLFHPVSDAAPLHIPVVFVSCDAADAIRATIGVSYERRPTTLVPKLAAELLAAKGFPTALVAKATARHPDSFLKAQRWLERHRDMLMMQHDLLTGLSADVVAAAGGGPAGIAADGTTWTFGAGTTTAPPTVRGRICCRWVCCWLGLRYC